MSSLFEGISEATLATLQQYTACDISDALLKLQVPGAGYLADLTAYSTKADPDATSPTIAPVSTILFVAKGETLAASSSPAANMPKGIHWADVMEPDTFVVMKQAPSQTNAICGGIMALRMKMRRVHGIIVAGRVRDVQELRSTNLPVSLVSLHHPLFESEHMQEKLKEETGKRTAKKKDPQEKILPPLVFSKSCK